MHLYTYKFRANSILPKNHFFFRQSKIAIKVKIRRKSHFYFSDITNFNHKQLYHLNTVFSENEVDIIFSGAGQ